MSKRRVGRTVKIFEIGQLYSLSHAQDIGRGTEAVEKHPHVPSIKRGDLSRSFGAGVAIKMQCMLNIRPCCNYGTQDNKTKGEECQSCHGSTEPQYLSIGGDYDGQVLENGEDGNGEVLKSFCASIDHSDQKEGDGKP